MLAIPKTKLNVGRLSVEAQLIGGSIMQKKAVLKRQKISQFVRQKV